jgi:hypothetical protein
VSAPIPDRIAQLEAAQPVTRREKVAIALELAHLRGLPYVPRPDGPPETDYGVLADVALEAALPTDDEVEAAVMGIPMERYEATDPAEIVRAVLKLLDPPDDGEHVLDVVQEKLVRGWKVTGSCFSCRRIWTATDQVMGLADQAVRMAHRDYLEQPTDEEPLMLVGHRTSRSVSVTDRRMPRTAH